MSVDSFIPGSKLPPAATHPLKRSPMLAQSKVHEHTEQQAEGSFGPQILRARCQEGHYNWAVLVRPRHRHHWTTGSAKAIPTVTHRSAKQTNRALRRSTSPSPILRCKHGSRACQDGVLLPGPSFIGFAHYPHSPQIPPLSTPFPKTGHGLPMIDCFSLHSPRRTTTN